MPRNFQNVHRIVVKIGTSSLTHESGKLNLHRIDRLSRDVCDLKNQGKEVLLVSSGAIAAGVSRLHLPQKPSYVSGRQAMACVGQSALMEIYNKCFADYGYNAGQLLLTKDVFDNEERKKNFQNADDEMLINGILLARNRYGKFDPRRYVVVFVMLQFYFKLRDFGSFAWNGRSGDDGAF